MASDERPESKSPMGEEIGGPPVAPPGDEGGVINPAPGSGEGHSGEVADLESSEVRLAVVEALWRTGRKVGRTIYAMVAKLPSDDDELIGVMDTRELAQAAVNAHNTALSDRKASG